MEFDKRKVFLIFFITFQQLVFYINLKIKLKLFLKYIYYYFILTFLNNFYKFIKKFKNKEYIVLYIKYMYENRNVYPPNLFYLENYNIIYKCKYIFDNIQINIL